MLSKFIRCGFVSLFWTKAYSAAQKALLGPHAHYFDYLKLHFIVLKMAFGVPRPALFWEWRALKRLRVVWSYGKAEESFVFVRVTESLPGYFSEENFTQTPPFSNDAWSALGFVSVDAQIFFQTLYSLYIVSPATDCFVVRSAIARERWCCNAPVE